MSRLYFALLGFCGLMLAGCNPDSKTREVATAPPAPVAADTAAPRASDPAETLALPTERVAPAELTPAKHTAARQIRPLPLAVAAGPERPEKAGELTPAPTLSDTSVAPSVAAVLSPELALQRFLSTGLPGVQEFELRPGRDTVLLGAQGTQILVPADAWDLPPGSGPVRLQVREFYSVADMVLAGLSTTAGTELLETGGMLHLSARTADGQPVAAQPGAGLRLRMPTREVKPGMQLYVGEPTAHGIDWQADTAGADISKVPGLVPARRSRKRNRLSFWRRPRRPGTFTDQWPAYQASSARRQERQLARQLEYPLPLISRLRRSRALAPERVLVSRYNRFISQNGEKAPRIKRLAAVEFTVDTTGATTKVQLRPGFNAELGAPLVNAVKSWGQWTPAHLFPRVAGTRVNHVAPAPKAPAIGVVWVMITAQNDISVTEPAWDAAATFKPQDNQAAAAMLASYRVRVAGNQARYDSVRRAGGDASAYNPAVTDADFYHELSGAGLSANPQGSWINCDQPLPTSQPLLVYQMEDQAPDAQLVVVLRGNRSLVNGAHHPGRHRVLFSSLPFGAEATLVAMRWERGRALLATCPTTLGKPLLQPTLNYRPVTMLELQKALAALD